MTSPRYALYYAPPQGSALETFGNHWLGRGQDDINAPHARFQVPGLNESTLQALTAEPWRYGFHGTLKPPFTLDPDTDRAELEKAVRTFCARQHPFAIAGWDLRWIGTFAALIPCQPCPELDRLAAHAVQDFDRFRAPSSAADLERRRAKGLSARQDDYLVRWGYPYVMEEFRFHLTLTGPVTDADQRRCLESALDPLTRPWRGLPHEVSEIALFRQDERRSPFVLERRYAFGAREER